MTTPQYMRRPILVWKEGVDTSQGKQQIISNINACQNIADILRSTLGPFGMDKLFCFPHSKSTITNDGATIVDLLNVCHPAARILIDISKSQDAEVGDGTTSVVLFAGELLAEAKNFLNEDLAPQVIINNYQKAAQLALKHLHEIQIDISKKTAEQQHFILTKCARTSLNSKLVSVYHEKFATMVVDVVQEIGPKKLDKTLVGIKKVPGGSVEDSFLVRGVAFKKTFSYAGFEMQPKKFQNPKIALLNIELELKAEKENAEVRISNPDEYQSIVDAEWKIIFDKLDAIIQAGVHVVLSRLPIGDLATQYFADHDIFCAGRVDEEDMKRVAQATGGIVQSTVSNLTGDVFGTCVDFEEMQIGSERYNVFKNCPKTKSATFILRGGAQQFLDETERSLNDAIMAVHRAMRSSQIVAGGGAVEMRLSNHLRNISRSMNGKQQLIVNAYAKSLECIPRYLATNCCLDQVEILNKLRQVHHQKKDGAWLGINGFTGQIEDTYEAYIWESATIKSHIITAATEAACLILSVDETIKNPKSASPETAAQKAMSGRGLRK